MGGFLTDCCQFGHFEAASTFGQNLSMAFKWPQTFDSLKPISIDALIGAHLHPPLANFLYLSKLSLFSN